MPPRRPWQGRRPIRTATVAAAAAGGAAVVLRWSLAAPGFVAAPSISASSSLASGLVGTQLLLADGAASPQPANPFGANSPLFEGGVSGSDSAPLFSEIGTDPYFAGYLLGFVGITLFGIYSVTKPFWEQRWLQERVNNAKLKFITAESSVTPEDQYELGRLYIALPDPSSALAEFEEVEEEFDDMRRVLDPEDAMGALAARAMLHNSKGFALTNLEPPRTAQARREFVRAVTYWPEYPEGLLNIGRELIKRKRYDVALRTLNTAMKWQPGSDFIQKATEQAKNGLEEQEYESEYASS